MQVFHSTQTCPPMNPTTANHRKSDLSHQTGAVTIALIGSSCVLLAVLAVAVAWVAIEPVVDVVARLVSG